PRWTEALPGAKALCRDAASAAFEAARQGASPAEASVVLADDAFQRALNREYRNTDAPTNVLAFRATGEADGLRPPPGAPTMLGDIVVAFETAADEAEDEKKALADHLSHLVVHGMLHLLGHDHQTAAAAKAMERLEVAVLAGLDIADPYAAGRPRRTDT
ncbi:MAG: rRNA maturation RNase YbeY, partial [Rhodospirillales bacterium]